MGRDACVLEIFGRSVGGKILPKDLLYNNIIITINRYVYRFPNNIIYYIVGLARVAFIIITIYRYHLFGHWDRRVVAINSSLVVRIVKYYVVGTPDTVYNILLL